MNTSITEARRAPGKRLGLFALALAVACAGMFGLASSKAQASPTASPFQMELGDGLLNLGAAFNGQRILPAPAQLNAETVLPNWWDIVDSTTQIAVDPTTRNACSIPVALADPTAANTLFPCGTNPAEGIIQAAGATALGTSTWDPSTGAIALNRVLPGSTGGAGTPPWSEPFNLDVRFPIMVIPSPLTGGPIPITLAATGQVEGQYSSSIVPATATKPPAVGFGEGTLTLKPKTGVFEARVLVGLGIETDISKGLSPQPWTYCSVPLPGLEFSTTSGAAGSKGFPATPFLSGLEGSGALQGTYKVEADSTLVTQKNLTGDPANPETPAGAAAQALEQCANVNLVSKGDGGIWIGNRAEVPACEDGQIGEYPNCADPKANITKIALSGKKSVKGGKTLTLTVRVTNKGTADEKVKVGIFTNSTRAKAPKPVTVNARAGATGSKKVKIKTKKGKGKVVVSASNGSRTGKLSVKIK